MMLEFTSDVEIRGVKITGCTIHLVTDDLDCGPILLQEAVEVRNDDDPTALHARIREREHRLLPEAVRAIIDEVGNETRATDPRGKVWTKTYDAKNRILTAKDPYLNTGTTAYDVEFPAWFVTNDQELSLILQPLWDHPHMRRVERHGCSFWLLTK